jgi:hypothetical protein
MSSRIRFTVARQIFDTFRSAGRVISLAPSDEEPLAFARKLAQSRRPIEAVAFCAYLLPRREAVWWACQCVRAIEGQSLKNDAALAAAEAWVRDPEEATQRAALLASDSTGRVAATSLLARAAGWSGGNISRKDGRSVAAQPNMTAKAVYAAIGLAIARAGAVRQAAWTAACIEAGIRFAEGGDARPRLTPEPRT